MAAARSAAGRATGVTFSIGVYSMYPLFSQTKITGRYQIAARLSASWKAPMFVAPSPKKQAVTRPASRIWLAQPRPAAMGRWAPMMAWEPM